jgi:hypothetical protein
MITFRRRFGSMPIEDPSITGLGFGHALPAADQPSSRRK